MMFRIGTLLVALMLGACASQPSADGKDAAESLTVGKNGLQIEWRRTIGTGSGTHYTRIQPVVADGVLYMADRSGSVVALQLDDGSEVWSVSLDQKISAGVSLVDGKLLLATRDGVLHALSADDGESIWQAPMTSEAVSPAGFDADKAYVHTVDGRISAFDLATGAQRWSYETSMPILSVRGTASPVVMDNLVVTGLANGKVVAIDKRLGVPSWDVRLATPEGRSELERLVDADGTVHVDGKLIYAASYHGKLAAISADGQTRWETDGSSYTSPAMGLGNLYLTLDDSSVRAFDVYSGNPVWKSSTLAGRQLGAVESWGSQLAVVDEEGYLYLLSQVDGDLQARLPLIPNALHISYPNQTEATRWRRVRGQHFGAYSPLLVTPEGLVVYTNNGDVMLVSKGDQDS
ncbi:outer membrane protein assembly factor BamB [Oceanobacter mangrovi]|uniref:outer membrane protein assembly factor BamB n=1 Tax=Oceanobacter mangrovi TaxID=2862510 RepID=UPI001C8E83CD|nr:outer membrane protein assembly factor BamB [Oceanobacter mangrovi]